MTLDPPNEITRIDFTWLYCGRNVTRRIHEASQHNVYNVVTPSLVCLLRWGGGRMGEAVSMGNFG